MLVAMSLIMYIYRLPHANCHNICFSLPVLIMLSSQDLGVLTFFVMFCISRVGRTSTIFKPMQFNLFTGSLIPAIHYHSGCYMCFCSLLFGWIHRPCGFRLDSDTFLRMFMCSRRRLSLLSRFEHPTLFSVIASFWDFRHILWTISACSFFLIIACLFTLGFFRTLVKVPISSETMHSSYIVRQPAKYGSLVMSHIYNVYTR